MDKQPDNLRLLISLTDSALELSCSPRTVLRAKDQGLIRGRKIGGKWLFTRKSILAYGLGFGPRLSATERKEFQELTG